MRRRKPDLLLILTFLLGIGIILTTYGGRLLMGLDVHAHPFSIHKVAQSSQSAAPSLPNTP